MNQLGIDISDSVFDVSMQSSAKAHRRQFPNTPGGHRQFIKWSLKNSDSARVCMEATGIYHLQLALALHRQAGIEVMVVNPRAARRISKQGNARLRTALFMPALSAIRHDANVKAFYNALLARGKAKMQAIIAVMRKLLHAIWGMLHHRQERDGSKFYRLETANMA